MKARGYGGNQGTHQAMDHRMSLKAGVVLDCGKYQYTYGIAMRLSLGNKVICCMRGNMIFVVLFNNLEKKSDLKPINRRRD